MLDRILRYFPPDVYPLTLVSDPDHVLADETILNELAERGFSILNETDPIQLRYRLSEMGEVNSQRPLILITPDSFTQLPYDLWQQGHHVTLALYTFFPTLNYQVLKELTSQQRWQLSQHPPPDQKLGREETIVTLLHQVYGVDFAALQETATLIAWLNRYHTSGPKPMPVVLAAYWRQRLQANPIYDNWPLGELLTDRTAFAQFMEEQWRGYVRQQTGARLREAAVPYVLSFASNHALQDTLPQLVRSGALQPVIVSKPTSLPGWAHIALLAPDENAIGREVDETLSLLEAQCTHLADARWPPRWSQWQTIARTWARLTLLRSMPDNTLQPAQLLAYQVWQEKLDESFFRWLQPFYAPLGSKKLPVPSHLHHVAHYLAYQRRQPGQQATQPIALLIMDGMALADWLLIKETWRGQHREWQFAEHLVLAQLPTITAVSRQALVSGLRPADFAASLSHNRSEAKQWAAFWQQENLLATACAYVRLRLGKHVLPAVLDSPRIEALCLVNHAVDDMVHRAGLGAADVQASLRLWLQEQSPQLEAIIEALLQREYAVYLTSDHGHVEAEGMGQPDEGVLVETRSKRARLYANQATAEQVQQAFPATILWHDDGLLPDDSWALVAGSRDGRRLAFAPRNEQIVSHGGLTIDEVVVPFVQIKLD